MGEGMIPDTMSFFYNLPEQFFIAFYLVSDAKKAGWYVFFSLHFQHFGSLYRIGPVIKSDGYDFLFGLFTTEDAHVNTGTDAVRSVKEKGHDAYYDDYRN